LLLGVIGGFGGVLGSNPLAASGRINACARPGSVPIIDLPLSSFRAPHIPGCLETAYPTIQHSIGQTERPIAASTIVGPELSAAASGIVEPEALNVAASTIVGPELNVTLVEPELNVAASTIVEPDSCPEIVLAGADDHRSPRLRTRTQRVRPSSAASAKLSATSFARVRLTRSEMEPSGNFIRNMDGKPGSGATTATTRPDRINLKTTPVCCQP
jgi:hypothetical protein